VAEIFNLESGEALYALAAEIEQLRLQQGALVNRLADDQIPSHLRTHLAALRPIVSGAAAEFERLLERRDLAAYRLVSTVDTVILFWEAQDYEASLALLKRAHAEFKHADRQITEFRNLHKGELPRHGNHPAA
jgi:hypothetical protein